MQDDFVSKLTAMGLPSRAVGNAGQGGPDRRGIEEANRRPASVKASLCAPALRLLGTCMLHLLFNATAAGICRSGRAGYFGQPFAQRAFCASSSAALSEQCTYIPCTDRQTIVVLGDAIHGGTWPMRALLL